MSSLRLLGLATVVAAQGACAEPASDARDALVRNVVATAELPLVRTRPALVAGKWARMSQNLFAFYRGTLPLYLKDARDGSMRDSFSVALGKSGAPTR